MILTGEMLPKRTFLRKTEDRTSLAYGELYVASICLKCASNSPAN